MPQMPRFPSSDAVRMSVLFAALFLIFGVQLTYLPVWLSGRGLTAQEIAFATSVPMLLRIVITPGIAFVADRHQAYRVVTIGLAWTGATLLFAMSQITGPVAILVLCVAMLISLQSLMPMSDTIAMRAVRTQGLDYGRMRLWGSASFIVASFLAGYLVEAAGSEVILWLMLAAALATILAAYNLQSPSNNGATAAAVAARPRLSLADALTLLSDGRFMIFVVTASAIQASHAMFYVFGVLHWRDLGFSATAIGAAWGIAVLAEIWLFAVWQRRWGVGRPITLLLLGGGAGIVRWLLMTFDPPYASVLVLQILHALTYAATHLGAMQFIAANVADNKAGTAQALLASFLAGIAMSGATLMSGALYAVYGGQAYVAMAALAAIGVVGALALGLLRTPQQAKA